MGCCFSATTPTNTPQSDPNGFLSNRRRPPSSSDTNGGVLPPLPLPLPPLEEEEEEEAVKEVLSETPIPNPPLISIANDSGKKRYLQQTVAEEEKMEPTAVIKSAQETISEVSELSEMCSFSESLSAATEKREDDGEVTQRVLKSPAKVRRRPCSDRGKERAVRSVARRAELSPPAKRTRVASRSVQGRTMTKAAAAAAAARRHAGTPNGRNTGEGPGGRSRSPVTRGGEVGQRRPVRYKSPGKSGGRATAETVETVEEGGKGEKPNGEASLETTESLENPLVSMECFIFL
ncbi:hypothetical protein U1Q18_001484 [Sarracenia purpurea var. burkii]